VIDSVERDDRQVPRSVTPIGGDESLFLGHAMPHWLHAFGTVLFGASSFGVGFGVFGCL
jgi:hypothetical protein